MTAFGRSLPVVNMPSAGQVGCNFPQQLWADLAKGLWAGSGGR